MSFGVYALCIRTTTRLPPLALSPAKLCCLRPPPYCLRIAGALTTFETGPGGGMRSGSCQCFRSACGAASHFNLPPFLRRQSPAAAADRQCAHGAMADGRRGGHDVADSLLSSVEPLVGGQPDDGLGATDQPGGTILAKHRAVRV